MHTLCYDALMAPSLKLQAATRTVLPMTPLLGRGRAALASGKRKDSPPPQLFSLMLPSFDYLIHSSPNDYPDEPQENPCSPVLMSTLRPQRSMSPPPSPPPASLVPILRRSTRIAAVPPSASEVAASEEGKSTVMIVSDEEEDEALSDDVPSLASSLSSESLLMEDADTPMLPCSSDHSSHSQSSAPSSSSSAASSSSDYNFPPSLPRVTRNRSEGSAVSFCPRVWVRIFERSARERDRIWYTPSDMEGFKREALERVQQYYDHQRSCQATAPTGSRRVGVAPTSAPAARLLFSHQALQVECDVLSSDGGPASVEPEEEKEVRRVLVVDPHSACLDLLCRAFRLLFPRADVHAASRTDEALAHLRSHERWDVVAVEERLAVHGPAVGVGKDRRNSSMEISGSALLQGIKEKVSCAPPPLFIGITSHLEQDQERFRNAGADLVWPKPPPSVSHELREGLLRSLLRKRGKDRQSSP
jgi:CheY-like chemotaxis protein